MVFQVGIDSFNGQVKAYDDITFLTREFNIQIVKWGYEQKTTEEFEENINKMFECIKAELNGNLGNASILYINCHNSVPKMLIESGKRYGFSKVQTVNEESLKYLGYLVHANYKPKIGDLIWIFVGANCYIWKKTHTKAKLHDFKDFSLRLNLYITEKDLLRIKKDSSYNKNPDIIIYDNYFVFNIPNAITLFPACEYVRINGNLDYSELALIKARIMSNDLKFKIYEADMLLGINRKVKLNGKHLFSFNNYTSLPTVKTKIVTMQENENIFKPFKKLIMVTFENEWEIAGEIEITPETLEIGEIVFTFKIDENSIYDFDYSIPKINYDYMERQSRNILFQTTQLLKFPKLYAIPSKLFISNENFNAVGIDLGTTRCCVAVNKNKKIEVVAIENTGGRLMPSYVSFDGDSTKCGQIVVDRLRNNAKASIYDSKRIIGKKICEVNIDPSWPFNLINRGDKVMIEIEKNGEIIHLHPEDISTILLKHMKQKVEEFQGRGQTHVVLTTPTAFTNKQKIATYIAAKIAEWENIHFLPEPVAASIAYFYDRPIPSDNCRMLLFDLGGGTLDICIFQSKNNKLELLTNYGDSNLGGRDFDQLLFNHFIKLLKDQYQMNINSRECLKFRLMQKCIDSKHTLTAENETSLDVSDFYPNIDEFLDITRKEFEEMAIPLLNRAKEVVEQTLSKSKYKRNDIKKVVLVGGGCRMPMIQELLEKMFENAEILCDKNPDEIIAIGAAHYAYYLNT